MTTATPTKRKRKKVEADPKAVDTAFEGAPEDQGADIYQSEDEKAEADKKKLSEADEIAKYGDTLDNILTEVVDDFDASREYIRSNYKQKWQDCFALYNNERVNEGYEGISDIFIPMTFSTVETILANVAGSKPRFNFLPTHKLQPRNTKILQSLVDEIWENQGLSLKIIPWIRDVIMYGTGILYVAMDGDRPCVENIALPDFFADPTSHGPYDAAYMGHQFLGDKREMAKEEMIDEDTGEFVEKYFGLNEVTGECFEGDDLDDLDKEIKDRMGGTFVKGEKQKHQIHVIWHTTPEWITAVANRRHVIFRVTNPCTREEHTVMAKVQVRKEGIPDDALEVDKWESKEEEVTVPEIPGIMPYVVMRNYIDTSLFYGKGDVEVIMGLQEMLNDRANQNSDNISYALNNMWTLDPEYEDRKEEVESMPGAVLTFPSEALKPVEKPFMSNLGFEDINLIKQEMREAVGVGEVVRGVEDTGSGGGGNTTATEINAQVAQAGQRFNMKMIVLENEGYKQLARILFQFIKIFIDEETAVRTMEADGIDFPTYNPEEFWGNYDPRVMLDGVAKAQQMEKAQNAQAMYDKFAGSEFVRQDKLTKKTMMDGYGEDEDEVAELLIPMEEVMQRQAAAAQAQAMAAGGGMPGGAGGAVDPAAGIDYKTAPEHIKAQMETKAGFQGLEQDPRMAAIPSNADSQDAPVEEAPVEGGRIKPEDAAMLQVMHG